MDCISGLPLVHIGGRHVKCWGHWTDEEETDLQLIEFEFLAYSNPEFGSDKRLLESSDVANTFLHSYGHALMSCPCKCRQSGFSRNSLLRQGLRGCFVQSKVHHNPRYLHHVSLDFCWVFPALWTILYDRGNTWLCWGLLLRLCRWSGSMNNFARACDLPAVPSPLEWLRAYQRELLHQVQDLFRETDQPAALAYRLELWAQFCDHRDSGMASRSGGGFIVLMHYLILLLAFPNLLLALRLPRFCFCGLQAQL